MKTAYFYLLTITLAELLTTKLTEVRLGIILHSIILVSLILQGATTQRTSSRRLLLTLTLAPLIRILSVSLPLQNRPLTDWYLIIGSLLFLAGFFTARTTGISYRRMGFTLKGLPLQFTIALIGVGLGLMEFLILRPRPLIQELNWDTFLYPAFILLVFTGLLEEFIFRGLIQEAATESMGRSGILYGAVLFGVLHVGYLSVLDVIFVFVVGLLFGYIIQKTHSIVGVTLAHGLTNITMYLVFPFVFGGSLYLSPAVLINDIQNSAPPSTPNADIFHFPGRAVTPTPNFSAPTQENISASATLEINTTATPLPTATFFLLSPQPSTTSLICRSAPSTWTIYRVKAGDTLYGISQRYNVILSELKAVNCLTSDVINVGQNIFVPNTIVTFPETSTQTPELLPTNTVEIQIQPSETSAFQLLPTETPTIEPSPTQ